jgi:hypothetical protein
MIEGRGLTPRDMLQIAGLYDMVANVYEDVDVVLWSVDKVKSRV